MKRTYRNTYADGHIEFVEYEVNTPSETGAEEVSPEQALAEIMEALNDE